MEKKIRITLPKKNFDILKRDLEEYNIKKNSLLNFLYQELKDDFKIGSKNYNKKDTEIIQFNLNKKNREDYYEFLENNGIQNEAEFFRTLILKYTEMGRNLRELFLFKKVVSKLNTAITNRKVIKITFLDQREVLVEPYLISSSKQELNNYLFCFDLSDNLWKNYKIKYIYQVATTINGFEIRDYNYIQEMKKEFDPFLSKGKIVSAKFSTTGEKLLLALELNRPKIISKNSNIYSFECSIEKGKRYFSTFLDEVEILSPSELREWFITKFRNALKKYEN